MRAGEAMVSGLERGEATRWGLAFVAVLALHGVGAFAVLANWDNGPPAGGPPAIALELAALPESPSQEPTEAAPGPEQTQTAATPETEDKPDPTPDTEPLKAADTPVEQPDVTEAPTEVVEAPRPVETAEAKPDQPPPEQAPVETPIPEVVPAINPEVAVAVPPPPTKKADEEKHEPHKKPPPPKKKPPQQSAAATTRPTAAPKVSQRMAAANATEGSNASVQEWRARLVAHIQRHKRYPAEAQSRGQQGTATLRFSIDRGGRVLSANLAGSSGVAALDQETLALIRRASPLPPAPAAAGGSSFNFTVPIRFNIR